MTKRKSQPNQHLQVDMKTNAPSERGKVCGLALVCPEGVGIPRQRKKDLPKWSVQKEKKINNVYYSCPTRVDYYRKTQPKVEFRKAAVKKVARRNIHLTKYGEKVEGFLGGGGFFWGEKGRRRRGGGLGEKEWPKKNLKRKKEGPGLHTPC